MIADLLVNAEHYVHVHPGLEEAFEFLRQEKTKQLKPGQYAIDGIRLFALVECGTGKGTNGRRLEYHRKYIDIQYVRAGVDVMGCKPLSTGDGEVPGSASSSATHEKRSMTNIATGPKNWGTSPSCMAHRSRT